MIKKNLLFCVFFAMILMMTACTPTTKLTEDMNGQSITLKKGEALHLEIGGNPTTGYNWEISELDERVLKLESSDYKSSSMLIGSGGTYIYDFTAVGSGSTNLKLIYYRSFEKDIPPIETYEVFIEVE